MILIHCLLSQEKHSCERIPLSLCELSLFLLPVSQKGSACHLLKMNHSRSTLLFSNNFQLPPLDHARILNAVHTRRLSRQSPLIKSPAVFCLNVCLIFSLALQVSYIATKGDLQISVLLKLLSIKSVHILDFNLPFCLPGFLPHLFGAPWIKVHGGERTEPLNDPAASLSSTYPFQILPLPVLKNIMFLSLSGRHSSYTTAF